MAMYCLQLLQILRNTQHSLSWETLKFLKYHDASWFDLQEQRKANWKSLQCQDDLGCLHNSHVSQCEWAQVRISLIFHTKMHFVQSLTFLELWQNISTTNPSALMDTGFLWGFSCGSNLSHISKFATNLRLNLSWIGGRIFLPLSIKLSLSWECNFFNLTSNLQICQDPDILIGRNCEAKSQIQFSYLACPPQQLLLHTPKMWIRVFISETWVCWLL